MKYPFNLIALAIGVALAAPAIAQDNGAAVQVGAGVQAQTQTPVPDPVPPASPETGQGRSAQGAMDNATQGDAAAMQEQAGTPPPPPQQSQGAANANAGSRSANGLTWNTVDTDKDGKLSTTEVAGYDGLKANFSGMDGNSDGFVTQDEYRAYAQARSQPTGKP